MTNLDSVKTALLTVTDNVGHYEAHEQTDKYIVWAEDSQAAALWAGGAMIEQAIQGTIDYFTRTENDPQVMQIQSALTDADISWRLNSVQYEDDTRYIHYEWIFEVESWQE